MSHMNQSFDGRVVVITGGARGQGAEEGRMLCAHGATVVLADVLDDIGQQTADEIGANYLHLDVTDPDQWESVVTTVLEREGRIDGLVNNAGVWRSSSLTETTPSTLGTSSLSICCRGSASSPGHAARSSTQ